MKPLDPVTRIFMSPAQKLVNLLIGQPKLEGGGYLIEHHITSSAP